MIKKWDLESMFTVGLKMLVTCVSRLCMGMVVNLLIPGDISSVLREMGLLLIIGTQNTLLCCN